jgi:hypothetical protein
LFEDLSRKCGTVPESGAGQEKTLISVELENNQGSIKFIPVLRDNASGKKPSCPCTTHVARCQSGRRFSRSGSAPKCRNQQTLMQRVELSPNPRLKTDAKNVRLRLTYFADRLSRSVRRQSSQHGYGGDYGTQPAHGCSQVSGRNGNLE